MTITLSPTQSDIETALRSFLLALGLPGVAAGDVIAGQVNRAPEPSGADFIVFWPIMRPRLSTNVDTFADEVFTGSITGTVLTIATVVQGALSAGAALFGVGVAANTVVGAQISGTPGGVGTYNVSPTQTVGLETLAAGSTAAMQPTEVVMQLDVHGPNSSDNAQTISTLFRDTFATDLFAATNPAVQPLYADDPRQIPFLDAEQQVETRWAVDVHMQANQVVSGLPQQAASVISITPESVESAFPP